MLVGVRDAGGVLVYFHLDQLSRTFHLAQLSYLDEQSLLSTSQTNTHMHALARAHAHTHRHTCAHRFTLCLYQRANIVDEGRLDALTRQDSASIPLELRRAGLGYQEPIWVGPLWGLQAHV